MDDPLDITSFPYRENDRREPRVAVETRADGTLLVTTPYPEPDYPASICACLYDHGNNRAEQVFLAERNGSGGWDELTFGEMLARTRAVAQWFIDRDFGQDTPLMILSSNSINQAVITFGAMLAGVPVAPVSPPYALMSADFSRLVACARAVRPAALYVEQLPPSSGHWPRWRCPTSR